MKILYFAWVKQKIGTDKENISLPASIKNTGALIDWLMEKSPAYRETLSNKNVIRIARNQVYCGWEEPVTDTDEIAIFPPVTGG